MEGELSQKQKEQLGEVNLAFSGVEPVVRGVSHWAEQANAAVALNKRMMEALQVQSEVLQDFDRKFRALEIQLHTAVSRIITLENAREESQKLITILVPAIRNMMNEIGDEKLGQYGLLEACELFRAE